MADQKCMRCRTYFRGFFCPRCEYQHIPKRTPWRRAFMPVRLGRGQRLGDSEVRIVQEAYRATDPCE